MHITVIGLLSVVILTFLVSIMQEDMAKNYPLPLGGVPNFPPYTGVNLPGAKKRGCHALTVQRSVLGVAAVELIFVASVLALYLGFYFDLPDPAPVLVGGLCVGITLSVFALCFIILLIVGIKTSRPSLIQAHLAVQVMAICVMSSIGALVLLLNAVKYEFNPELGNQFPSVCLSIGILCLAMALAEVWFFFIVRDSQLELNKTMIETEAPGNAYWDWWVNRYSQLHQQQQQQQQQQGHGQAEYAQYAASQIYGTVENVHMEKTTNHDGIKINEIRELNITTSSTE